MKKLLKIIFVSVFSIALITGLVFFIRYELQLRKDMRQIRTLLIDGQNVPIANVALYTLQKQMIMEQFLSNNFPEEVKKFNETLPK